MSIKNYKSLHPILVVFLVFGAAFGRSKPVDGFNVYLLGEPGANKAFQSMIPNGESAVTALAVSGNGVLVGGTTAIRGKSPWLFTFNNKENIVAEKNLLNLAALLPGEKSVSSLVKAADGNVYGATNNYYDIDYNYEEDWRAQKYAGGCIFKTEVTETGVPSLKSYPPLFSNEGIVTLSASKDGWKLYGVTVPSQILFSFDIKSGMVKEIARLGLLGVTYHRFTGKATREIAVDTAGNIFGTSGGKFFRLQPESGKLDTFPTTLLNETQGDAYDCAASFVVTPENRIFCGTFLDGKLLELNPVTGAVKSLGITSRTGNLSSLQYSNGIIYGISGNRYSGGRPFTYNVSTGEYVKIPRLTVYFENTDKKFKYKPSNMFRLVWLPNGTLATGVNDFNGHLYTWKP